MIVNLLQVGKNIEKYIFTIKDLEKIRNKINNHSMIGEFGSPNIEDGFIKNSTINLINAGVVYKNAYIKDDSLYCEVNFINKAKKLISEIGIDNISFSVRGLYNIKEKNSFNLITFDIIPKIGI